MTAGPLVFLHIPKTGGTSLARLMQAAMRGGVAYTQPGNRLSAAYCAELAMARLPETALIHGHADWGACRTLLATARFVTVLRDPRAHIVSHYLHALRDPAMPQHAAAQALGFSGFLRTYRYAIPFQTHALYLAITDPAEERQRAMADPNYGDAFGHERYIAAQLAAVLAFLDGMMLVGTLNRIDAFVLRLGAAMGWRSMPALAHDNAAPAGQQAEARALLDQLDSLERDPELAALFAIERITFDRAASLGQAARGAGTVAHRSAIGEILLDANIEAASGGGWWTGRGQLSRLRISRFQPGPCVVTLLASRLHHVEPAEVLLCWAGRWLEVGVAIDAAGTILFSAVLEDNGAAAAELAVYLQWNRYPADPPFHPAICFSGFALARHDA